MKLLPPAILDARFPRSDGRRFHLWLPLFLLWPLLWLVWIVALVLAAVVDLVLLLAGREYHSYSLLLFGCYMLLCDTRGLAIHVKHLETKVDMTFA